MQNNDANRAASLQRFLDELTFGNAARSLHERQAMALTRYQPLADRLRSGDTTAFEDFKQIAPALIAIEREIHGSQTGYWDRVNEAEALLDAALKSLSQPRSVERTATPPSSQKLAEWWESLPNKPELDEAQCWELAKLNFPNKRVTRHSIRNLRGPQKRGPKIKC